MSKSNPAYVTVRARDKNAPAEKLIRKFIRKVKKAGIIVDSRPGCVRISPFFYNNESEIDHCVNVLSNLKNSDNSLF